MVNKGDFKVGLVGASSEIAAGDGYGSKELLPALKAVVEEVHSLADIVILLFHGTDRDKEVIQASGLPIDLILQSHVRRYNPDFGPGAILSSTLGSQGKYLHVITMTVGSPDKPLVDLTASHRTLSFVEKSLKRLRRNQPKDTPLEELYTDSPNILKRIEDLREREAKAQKTIAGAVNTVESERITLGSSVKDDQDLLSLVNAAKRAIEGLASPAVVQAGESTSWVPIQGSQENQDGS
ncbi:MAG: hypothetical protein JSU77_13730 [Fidelibacterota bacterium]|nr:MAG: hypothetical protein JSU77_13730 [Candidatus Neomarinimicrobiota bacterium]